MKVKGQATAWVKGVDPVWVKIFGAGAMLSLVAFGMSRIGPSTTIVVQPDPAAATAAVDGGATSPVTGQPPDPFRHAPHPISDGVQQWIPAGNWGAVYTLYEGWTRLGPGVDDCQVSVTLRITEDGGRRFKVDPTPTAGSLPLFNCAAVTAVAPPSGALPTITTAGSQ